MSYQNPFRCSRCDWIGKHVVESYEKGHHGCPLCRAPVLDRICPECKNLVYNCDRCFEDDTK